MKEYFEKFILVVIVGVIGAGLLIYTWNFFHGRNLAVPPKLDLSTFEPGGDFYDNWEKRNVKVEEVLAGQLEKKVQEQKLIQAENNPVTKVETLQVEKFIYFNNTFLKDSLEKTDDSLRKFLQNFPDMENSEIEYLQDFITWHIKLPVENREKLLNDLQTNEQVLELKVVEPPVWSLTFKEPMFIINLNSLLNKISPDIEVSISTKSYNPDYVAKIRYDQLVNVEKSIDKLKSEYSDVIVVD